MRFLWGPGVRPPASSCVGSTLVAGWSEATTGTGKIKTAVPARSEKLSTSRAGARRQAGRWLTSLGLPAASPMSTGSVIKAKWTYKWPAGTLPPPTDTTTQVEFDEKIAPLFFYRAKQLPSIICHQKLTPYRSLTYSGEGQHCVSITST